MSDFQLSGSGSVYLLHPISQAGKAWVQHNISDDHQTLGGGIAVEHRYVGALVDGIIGDGLSLGGLN